LLVVECVVVVVDDDDVESVVVESAVEKVVLRSCSDCCSSHLLVVNGDNMIGAMKGADEGRGANNDDSMVIVAGDGDASLRKHQRDHDRTDDNPLAWQDQSIASRAAVYVTLVFSCSRLWRSSRDR